MIHPKTEMKFIDDLVGYGVFASEFIPEGTIVYVLDNLEAIVSPAEFLIQNKEMKEIIEKYSYIDAAGNRIVSWDSAKYVNHSCNCNTISTGYGFEMAIRDIEKGEQITDEYGIFNLEHEMDCMCQEACCRKKLTLEDFDRYYKIWDEKIKLSIGKLFDVEQPLYPFISGDTRKELTILRKNPLKYKSVYALKYEKTRILNGLPKKVA